MGGVVIHKNPLFLKKTKMFSFELLIAVSKLLFKCIWKSIL